MECAPQGKQGGKSSSSSDNKNDGENKEKKQEEEHSQQRITGAGRVCVCFGCQEVLVSDVAISRASSSSSSSSGGGGKTNRSSDSVVNRVSGTGGGGGNKMSLQCPRCENIFCVECDIFIHDSLHNCPGCYLLE